jgi:hypothetical protein
MLQCHGNFRNPVSLNIWFHVVSACPDPDPSDTFNNSETFSEAWWIVRRNLEYEYVERVNSTPLLNSSGFKLNLEHSQFHQEAQL